MSALQDIKNSRTSFSSLPAKKQLDFIINHPTPLKLVRDTPTPDLLLIIREVGAESSLELVEMMHPHQIQELFDLEVWSNEQLNPKALAHYFSLLFEANIDTAVSQIHNLDIELIGVMFKMASTIYDLSTGEDAEDYPELFSKSPDGRFLICFSDEHALRGLAQMLHAFLEQLYGRDLSFALRLLESLRFELVSGLEEQCLRWRQNRLLDFGILPRSERLEYFSSVAISDIKRLAPQAIASSADTTCLVPSALMKRTAVDDFLKAALSQTSPEVQDAFWQTLFYATANIHASLSGDFGDKEGMTLTSRYVNFLVEAGLFQACQGKIDDAPIALQQYSTKFLIRLGRTTLINVRKRLTMHATNSDLLLGKDYCHVDSPLRETAKALSLSEPRYYEGLLSPSLLTIRYFLNLNELTITIKAVNEILFRARFLGSFGLGFTDKDMIGLAHLSHANIFARCMVNAYFGRASMREDVTNDDLNTILNGTNLAESFVDFANSFVITHAMRFAKNVDEDETLLLEKAQHFKSAVLIQLTQNSTSTLG